MLTSLCKLFIPTLISDRLRARQISREHLARTTAFYQKLLGAPRLVFDIGANRGDRTEAFRMLGAQVVAVEPQASCVAHLKKRFCSSGRITIIPEAVGEQAGQTDLLISDACDVLATTSKEFFNTTGESGRFTRPEKVVTEVVNVTTLDTLIAKFGLPDFIKIDVEGAELPVLAGLSQAPPLIAFEYTPECRDVMRACVTRCVEIGFTSFNISFGESFRFTFQSWRPQESLFTLIDLLKEDSYLFGDIYAKRL